MNYDNNNIFAKILRQELPCHAVYDTPHCLAFLDIMPQASGHTLVIPKTEVTTIHDMPKEIAGELLLAVQKVANAVKTAMQVDGITIFQLNGASAGQTVDHLHFHVVPGSIQKVRTHGSINADNEDLEQIAARIHAEIHTLK